MQVRSLGQEDPLEKGKATHSSILAWRIPIDREAWQAIAHRVTKSRTRLKQLTMHSHIHSSVGFPAGSMVKNLPVMQEPWVQSLGQEDPLEKEMASYSSILAWKIPWPEEPSRLQYMGSQRVGHD